MNLEEAVKTLENLKDNHFIRDKLERDCRCGGLKIGDIYKMAELNPAIETVLNYIEQTKKEKQNLIAKLEKDKWKNNKFEFYPLQAEEAYNNYYKLGKIDEIDEIKELLEDK